MTSLLAEDLINSLLPKELLLRYWYMSQLFDFY